MPLNDSFGGPKRGMIVREVVALTPRSQIYKVGHRFVHAHRQSDLDVVSTPWWFDSATVKQISETARRCGDSLDVVFRRFGAIAPRWGGSADLIVKAELATTLAAHRGPGTIQDFRDHHKLGNDPRNEWDLPLWVPSPSISQMYVPLVHQGVSHARQAFSRVHVVPIDKWDDAYLGSDPPRKWEI